MVRGFARYRRMLQTDAPVSRELLTWLRRSDNNDQIPEAVLDHIDTDELVKVTLDLAKSTAQRLEGPVTDYVHEFAETRGL